MEAVEDRPTEISPAPDAAAPPDGADERAQVTERCDELENALWAAGRELPVVGGPVRERADAARNRRRILAAAERLFARDGVAQVSMDAIAAEACVGKGTLFRRFGDRAGLARALIDEREREFQDSFIRGAPPLGPGAPPAQRLTAFGHGVLELLEGHGEIVAAAEMGSPGARQRSSPYGAYRAHVTAVLREADGDWDAEYLADALLGSLGAGLFLHQRGEREMPLERLRDGWTQLVRRVVPG
jgi:AcrR family transcriptional regulator